MLEYKTTKSKNKIGNCWKHMNQKQSGVKQTTENSCIWRLLGSTELQKSAKEEKEKSTYHIDPDIRAQEWQIPPLSISDPLPFFWAPIWHPPPLREAESRGSATEGESNTHGGGGGISPGVEMEGTVAAVHPRQYLLKSSPLLHVCLQHRGKRQRTQSDPLTHSPEKEREGEGERGRGRKTERARETSEETAVKKNKWARRPRQLKNSRFKFAAFPLLCRRTLPAEWEGIASRKLRK